MAPNTLQKQFFFIMSLFNFLIQFLKKRFCVKPLYLLLGLLFCSIKAEGAQLRHLYLTWQHDPTTTVTINVQGINTPTDLILYYDTQPHAGKIQHYPFKNRIKGRVLAAPPKGRIIYHAELAHLKPGERYYFILSDLNGGILGKECSFRTLPSGDDPLFFVEGGDWENTPEAVELAKCAAHLDPMAVLLGGDYPSSVSSKRDYKHWDDWLDVYCNHMITSEGCLIPMVLAIGNHEVLGGYGQSRAQVPFFFDYFKQGNGGKSYFSLPLGDQGVLYVLDSGHVAEHGGEQEKWLEQELKKYTSKSVKIALYHVPLYPSIRFFEKGGIYRLFYKFLESYKGKYLAEQLYSHSSSQGRAHWLPLFDTYGLTVAFEHHDQALKRTHLLRNGQFDSHGTLFLGDGGWGSKFQYPVIQGYFHRYFAQLRAKQHFFWTMSIDRETISYNAVTASGKVIDHFVQTVH